MALPTPNLDDRTWQDIVEEAKRIIPALCPHWTDFNPSDPGIALVELMAWMTEMLIYRLNRVPDKNYIKFLEMMGITLTPPKPASTWMVFDVVEGAEKVDLPYIPPNTRVSGTNADGETITFETTEPLNLNASRLVRIHSQFKETYTDLTADLLSHTSSSRQNIFDGGKPIDHIFYLGDTEIARVGDDFTLRIYVIPDKPGSIPNLRWACWNGENWQEISPALDETSRFSRSGEIVFTHLPPMQEKEIHGYTSYWLRLQLDKYQGEPLPRIKELKKALELKKTSGIAAARGYASTEQIQFIPLQIQGVFSPFGIEGSENDAFYFGSEVFARKGAPVSIDIRLADSYVPFKSDDLAELELHWEYYAESGAWELLGITSPIGVSRSLWDFIDASEAFTHSGKVSFYVPDDISPLELYGETGYWIRVRIHKGSYSIKKKKNPPICRSFLIFYKEKPTNFNYYLSYNEFDYKDLTLPVLEREVFEPFVPAARPRPELYLGFNTRFTNQLHRMFFRLARKGEKESGVTWEYSTREGWKKLNLHDDETRHFTNQGQVEFIGPPDWGIAREFGFWAFWLRIRWDTFTPETLPMIQCIHLNVVTAINAVSTKKEILGTSNGQPFQYFRFKQSPILPHPSPRILVKELESTIPQEIMDFKKKVKEKVVEELDPETRQVKALWVVWEEQPNFYRSDRNSRHYILDIYNGIVTFGDGIKGRIPLTGQKIVCAVYYIGGGSKGNMDRNTITNLETAYPFIDRVSNPYPASGGADMETIDEAKLRAPWELKHRSRAVTTEDFEELARCATAEVARAICWSYQEGTVKIVIIPHGNQRKLEPSDTLCDVVKKYLDERRLVTTRIEAAGPAYVDISIQAEIVLEQHMVDQFPQVRQQINDKLEQFFHPLTGGLYGRGWPMGRAVHLSELYYLIENVTGVDYVDMLILDNTPGKDRIPIPGTSFPYLKEIDVKISGGE
jgi:hypothetical protein